MISKQRLGTAWVCATVSAGGLLAVAGCHGNHASPDPADPIAMRDDTADLSKEQLMARGQQMVQQGQSQKEQAEQMNPGDSKDGLSRDDLMSQADEMIKQGQTLRDRAMKM